MEDAIDTLIPLLLSPDPATEAQGWELCAALPPLARRQVAEALAAQARWGHAVLCLDPTQGPGEQSRRLRRFAVRCVAQALPLWEAALPGQPAVAWLLTAARRCADGEAGEHLLTAVERRVREDWRRLQVQPPQLPPATPLVLEAALRCARRPFTDEDAEQACHLAGQALRLHALDSGQDPVAAEQRARRWQATVLLDLLA